jgi:hypothetical protein
MWTHGVGFDTTATMEAARLMNSIDPIAAAPRIERGPHPVTTMACRDCSLVYYELARPPRVRARQDMPAEHQPPGAHGCPRCGSRRGQDPIGRTEA